MGILLMYAELRLVPRHLPSPPLPIDVYRSLSTVSLAVNTKINYKVGASGGLALSRWVFFPRGRANYWSGDVRQFSRFYLRSSSQHEICYFDTVLNDFAKKKNKKKLIYIYERIP